MLNTKNRIIAIKTISVGTLNSSIVHPREVFKEAVLNSSASIIAVHNHPSSVLPIEASKEDIETTQRLKNAADIIGIKLLDHIIISETYFSFKERGLL